MIVITDTRTIFFFYYRAKTEKNSVEKKILSQSFLLNKSEKQQKNLCRVCCSPVNKDDDDASFLQTMALLSLTHEGTSLVFLFHYW